MSKEFARSSKRGCGDRAAGQAVRIDEHMAAKPSLSKNCVMSGLSTIDSDESISFRYAPNLRQKVRHR